MQLVVSSFAVHHDKMYLKTTSKETSACRWSSQRLMLSVFACRKNIFYFQKFLWKTGKMGLKQCTCCICVHLISVTNSRATAMLAAVVQIQSKHSFIPYICKPVMCVVLLMPTRLAELILHWLMTLQNSLVIFKDCSTKVSVTRVKEPVGDQLQATLQPFGECSTNQSLRLCNWTLKNKLYSHIE